MDNKTEGYDISTKLLFGCMYLCLFLGVVGIVLMGVLQ